MAAAYKSISPDQISFSFTEQPRIQQLKKSMAQRITEATQSKWPELDRPATPDPRKRAFHDNPPKG